jgi:hypothetical protein
MDKALSMKVNVVVNRMQAYADGMESNLRAELGLKTTTRCHPLGHLGRVDIQ